MTSPLSPEQPKTKVHTWNRIWLFLNHILWYSMHKGVQRKGWGVVRREKEGGRKGGRERREEGREGPREGEEVGGRKREGGKEGRRERKREKRMQERMEKERNRERLWKWKKHPAKFEHLG